MKWLRIGFLAVGLLGCAGDPTEPSGQVPVVLRTQPEPPTDGVGACRAALLEGTLVVSESSGISVEKNGNMVHVAWPFGYSGQVDAAGLHLLDETGAVVASIGDTVQVGGGEGNDGIWFACGGITAVAPA